MKFIKNQKYLYSKLSNCIKILAADSIQRANSGHPGLVFGLADVVTILNFNFLRFNPDDPCWFNRDRLVLSAGHGSMLLYSLYYLNNYKNFTLEDIKAFRQLHSKTPGHPEYGIYEAVESTTGPLGQGLANAVGMSIAQKKHNLQLGSAICNYKIYCIVGDGCLMEGISYEAVSLAGHLKLNNLIVLFDNNGISIDGATNLAVSEDHLAKFLALGWNVKSIDGHDFNQIQDALQQAQESDKPCFISCATVIAKGCINKENSPTAHGEPLGVDEIVEFKKSIGVENKEFFIPDALKNIWDSAWLRNKEEYDTWMSQYHEQYKMYCDSLAINLEFIDRLTPNDNDISTRELSGYVIQGLTKNNSKIICGSADLSVSNNIQNINSHVINHENFTGNFIHYGARENAMSAIMNGLSLSGFLPIGGTFLVFSDYMKPSIRLSAIMQRQVIYVMTHDSINVGEDGPTHQPIEHIAALRAIPNLLLFRPADFREVAECWYLALQHSTCPSVLALTRQKLHQIRKQNVDQIIKNNLSSKGAYILSINGRIIDYKEHDNLCVQYSDMKYDITIFATGSELSVAQEVSNILYRSGYNVCVVSIPCFELFFKQPKQYINSILQIAKLKVAIEAASDFGWYKIIGENSLFFGVNQFGLSAPAHELYEYFGFNPRRIAIEITKTYKQIF